MDTEADRSLCWLHRSYCRLCHALAHFRIEMRKYYLLFSGATIKVMFLVGWGVKGRGGLIWALLYENVSSGICRQRRPISACASLQSDQGLHCPLTESLGATECMNREQRPG